MGIGKECEWRSFSEIPVACTIVVSNLMCPFQNYLRVSHSLDHRPQLLS